MLNRDNKLPQFSLKKKTGIAEEVFVDYQSLCSTFFAKYAKSGS